MRGIFPGSHPETGNKEVLLSVSDLNCVFERFINKYCNYADSNIKTIRDEGNE